MSHLEIKLSEITALLTKIRPERTCHPTDMDNGRLFAEVFKSVLRYSPDYSLWCCKVGDRWEHDTGKLAAFDAANLLFIALQGYFNDVTVGSPRLDLMKAHYEKLADRLPRENMIKEARTVYPLKKAECLPPKKGKQPTGNG